MNSDFFMKGEIEAAFLIHKRQSIDTEPVDFHGDGNKIIALAEQIKAERAV